MAEQEEREAGRGTAGWAMLSSRGHDACYHDSKQSVKSSFYRIDGKSEGEEQTWAKLRGDRRARDRAFAEQRICNCRAERSG